jgi:hypothetical protein
LVFVPWVDHRLLLECRADRARHGAHHQRIGVGAGGALVAEFEDLDIAEATGVQMRAAESTMGACFGQAQGTAARSSFISLRPGQFIAVRRG